MNAVNEELTIQMGHYQGNTSEHLAFRLGSEEYGIEILKVQEIRRVEAITRIVNTPDCIKGVINLRGRIVPIIDLRLRFNLEEQANDHFKVVIILNLTNQLIGIAVDGVSDVITLEEADIRSVPDIVATIDTKHVSGIASIDDRTIILVDIEKLMLSADMALVDDQVH